jgi:RecB family exonuclease
VQSEFAGLQATAAVAHRDPPPRRVGLRRIVNDRMPEPPPAVFWARAAVSVSEPPEVTYEWVGDALRHVGTVVHAFLARIGREGLEHWRMADIRSHSPAIGSMLRNLGLSGAELEPAVDQVMTALMRSVSDDRGRWILGRHSESSCELSVSGVAGGQVVEAVIDRTFVDASGVRWIIDYKTGSHSGGSAEEFLANEKRRYEEQLERYARMLGQTEDRVTRLGLYYPLVEPGWIEWEARAIVRQQASLFAD